MTIQEFYTRIGGDYNEVLERLMNEKRILKYVYKFQDMPDYNDMLTALDEGRIKDAFRFSHNLKGMGLNLSLGRLASSSHDLCELLRPCDPGVDYSALLAVVKRDYADVMEAITELKATFG